MYEQLSTGNRVYNETRNVANERNRHDYKGNTSSKHLVGTYNRKAFDEKSEGFYNNKLGSQPFKVDPANDPTIRNGIIFL